MKISLVFLPPWSTETPPFGITSLSAWLLKHGFQTSVHDFNILSFHEQPAELRKLWGIAYEARNMWKNFSSLPESLSTYFLDKIPVWASVIMEQKPQVVGFSIYSDNLMLSGMLASELKRIDRNVKVVYGGPLFPGSLPEEGVIAGTVADRLFTVTDGSGTTSDTSIRLSHSNKHIRHCVLFDSFSGRSTIRFSFPDQNLSGFDGLALAVKAQHCEHDRVKIRLLPTPGNDHGAFFAEAVSDHCSQDLMGYSVPVLLEVPFSLFSGIGGNLPFEKINGFELEISPLQRVHGLREFEIHGAFLVKGVPRASDYRCGQSIRLREEPPFDPYAFLYSDFSTYSHEGSRAVTCRGSEGELIHAADYQGEHPFSSVRLQPEIKDWSIFDTLTVEMSGADPRSFGFKCGVMIDRQGAGTDVFFGDGRCGLSTRCDKRLSKGLEPRPLSDLTISWRDSIVIEESKQARIVFRSAKGAVSWHAKRSACSFGAYDCIAFHVHAGSICNDVFTCQVEVLLKGDRKVFKWHDFVTAPSLASENGGWIIMDLNSPSGEAVNPDLGSVTGISLTVSPLSDYREERRYEIRGVHLGIRRKTPGCSISAIPWDSTLMEDRHPLYVPGVGRGEISEAAGDFSLMFDLEKIVPAIGGSDRANVKAFELQLQPSGGLSGKKVFKISSIVLSRSSDDNKESDSGIRQELLTTRQGTPPDGKHPAGTSNLLSVSDHYTDLFVDVIGNLMRSPDGPDYLVTGEGEGPMLSLCRALERGENTENLVRVVQRSGNFLIYRNGGMYIDPGELPTPDFEGLDLNCYTKLPVSFSRGCRNHCRFCRETSFWRYFRTKSSGQILNEIIGHVKKHYGNPPFCRRVHFLCSESAINGDPSMLRELAEGILAVKVNVEGRIVPLSELIFFEGMASIRPEMDKDLLCLLKAAGFGIISYGIESGSSKVLSLMGKKFTPAQALEVIKATHKAGIYVMLNMMVGYPGEEFSDFLRTAYFLIRSRRFSDKIGTGYPCVVADQSLIYEHPLKHGVVYRHGYALTWRSTDGRNRFSVRRRRLEWLQRLVRFLSLSSLNIIDPTVK
ncbi:MAG: radical SAM protein [Candidatus Wallbacteria bacterium]|nr:radical SAM protein [Candidatus Wallbacteria bacterium]